MPAAVLEDKLVDNPTEDKEPLHWLPGAKNLGECYTALCGKITELICMNSPGNYINLPEACPECVIRLKSQHGML